MHRSPLVARIFAMGIELKIHLPASKAPLTAIVGFDDVRSRHIDAMADSLVEMFGDAALSVARGQPGERDVAGSSGIYWSDVVQAFRIR